MPCHRAIDFARKKLILSLTQDRVIENPMLKDRVIENPIIKDRVTFVKTTEETNGEYLLFKLEIAPQGGNVMHYHTTFTEKFEVVEGQLNVMLNGEHRVLEAGQSALVPMMAHHRFFSTSDKPVTAIVEIRPARQFEKSLRIAYGLARDG
jgi:mannose-6-phosphate isomerase-like protein (cupin superfamily)